MWRCHNLMGSLKYSIKGQTVLVIKYLLNYVLGYSTKTIVLAWYHQSSCYKTIPTWQDSIKPMDPKSP
jgi:hypothetical protein